MEKFKESGYLQQLGRRRHEIPVVHQVPTITLHRGVALANSKQIKGNDVSVVIQFLETLGRNPMLTADNYERAVAALDVDQAHQAALVARNPEALIGLLNCRESMVCMVWAPDQEPMKKDDDQEEQQIPLEEEPPTEQ